MPAKRLAWSLFALGLCLRAAYGVKLGLAARGKPLPDPDHYVLLARSFADTWDFRVNGRPSAEREPAYPLVLGAAFKVLGQNYGAIVAVNLALGAAVLLLLLKLGRDLFGEAAGLTAMAFGALYPPFIYYGAQPYRETALALAAVLTLLLLIRAHRAEGAARFAPAGAAAAAAALTKTTFLPFGLLLAPLGILALCRKPLGLRRVGMYLGSFLFVYSLWPLRNALEMGSVILGATEGGGNNFYVYQVVPQEVGGTPAQAEIMLADPVCREAEGLSPSERDRFFWRAGLARVRADPLRYARLVAWRFFIDFWRVMPRERNYEHSASLLRWVSLLSDGWILPAGLLGLLMVRRAAGESLWLLLFVFSEAFSYSLVFTIIRYRFASMTAVILLAAYAPYALRAQISRESRVSK